MYLDEVRLISINITTTLLLLASFNFSSFTQIYISAANTNYDVSRVDYYSVIVTDANSCSARLDYITIGEPDGMFTISWSSTLSLSTPLSPPPLSPSPSLYPLLPQILANFIIAFSVDVQASHISCKNYQDGNLSAVAKGMFE